MKKIYRLFGMLWKLIFGRYPKLLSKLDYDAYWQRKRGKNFGKLTDFQFNRLRIVQEEIEPQTTLKDVGCGEGSFLRALMKGKHFKEIYGLDVSKDALKHIKGYGVIPIAVDLNKTNNKNLPKTDYSTLLELLEHLNNPEEQLMQIIKSTKRKVIFSVPNTGFVAHRLRLLFGSFPLQWRTNPSEHVRFWTLRDMRWWLRELGLEGKSKIKLYEGIPFLNKIWPGLFAQGMVVIITK